MVQLFYKDNKRYEWLMEKLNMKDFQLVESYPYKRVTKYEKFVNEIKLSNEQKRLEKLNEMKQKFEIEKVHFYKERDEALLEIQKELTELGYKEIQFPLLNK